MSLFGTYLRALSMLRAERWVAIWLVAANLVVAFVQLAEPILFGRVVDALSGGREAFGIIGLWAAIGVFGILSGVVIALGADRLAHRSRLAAMAQAFERALTLPLSYLGERGSARVLRSILAGTDALFALWLSFFREHMAGFIGILFLVPTAIVVDWRLAAILGVLAVVYTAVNVLVVRRTQGGQQEVERYHQDISGRVGDVIGNVTVVQSYARIAAESTALRNLMGQLLAAQYPVLTWWAILTILTRAAATITMVAVFTAGSVLAARGEVSVGEIVSFVAFAGLLIGRLDQLSGFVMRTFVQAPVLNAFYELVDTAEGVVEAPGAAELADVRGHVAYQGVTFRFPNSSQGVFDLSFEAKPGQTVALVGPTGSGKTTALALLQRLRDPHQGRILIDGMDIRSVTLASLRHAIAVVFQDAGLFNRSIAENIRLGKPEATDEEVREAARLAEADDFIARKPGDYSFVIGERGQSLSGGERQRLAIARAILKATPIMILDEATSALDVQTEAKIKRAFDAVRKGRTTFIIAHRLSTVADADLILLLDAGRIVERGSFQELVRQGGRFAQLVAEGGLTQPREKE